MTSWNCLHFVSSTKEMEAVVDVGAGCGGDCGGDSEDCDASSWSGSRTSMSSCGCSPVMPFVGFGIGNYCAEEDCA